ncbi:hypothetical protein R1sor_019900 [Riccia sorocarpa]|uniref:Uncharacterized protein n=1 Tax=Riccia sorocarpa TaxID=122646 RepID=A0ABD3IDU0_9MARC
MNAAIESMTPLAETNIILNGDIRTKTFKRKSVASEFTIGSSIPPVNVDGLQDVQTDPKTTDVYSMLQEVQADPEFGPMPAEIAVEVTVSSTKAIPTASDGTGIKSTAGPK